MINTIFVVLTWVVGAVATVGPVAVIVGLIFFPAIIVPLISRIAKAFMECVPCIVAVACVLACLGSYWVGHHDAASDCRAEQLEAKLRNQRVDLENAKKAAADESERAKTIEEKANARQKDDAVYIAHLEGRPACVLDDNDLGGMPNNRSGAGRKKPSRAAR